MTDLNRINSTNLDAVTAGGVATPANKDGAPTTWGVTLVASTTYYFVLGAPRAPVPAESPLVSVHLWGKTAGLIITSAGIEDSNMLLNRSPDGRGPADVVTDFDQTVGAWIPENPAGATTQFVGTGWNASAATVTAAGSGLGGAMWHLGNLGSGRVRLRVQVGATGGLVQVSVRGKAAA